MDEPSPVNGGVVQQPTEFKPGDTISPSGAVVTNPTVSQPTVLVAAPDSIAPQPTQPTTATPAVPEPAPTLPSLITESSNTKPDEPSSSESQDAQDDDSITWTASEFIAHAKSLNWYLALGLVGIVAAVIIFLLTGGDKITTGVVVIAFLSLGAYASRKPRELQYSLQDGGLSIGGKYFLYDEFRSFSIVDDGALASIVFSPMKRFGQLLTVYFDPRDGDAIIDLLSDRLPLEDRQHDAVERLMRKIRF